MNGLKKERIEPAFPRYQSLSASVLAAMVTTLLLAAPALADEHGRTDSHDSQHSRDFPDYDHRDGRSSDRDSFQFAVMGDTGYSNEGVAQLDNMIDAVNAQRSLEWVIHNGDFKGGQTCADTFLQGVFSQFQQSNAPFVYTPGDNEWADCHGAGLGGFLPTERLTRLRQIFFPVPGMTIGKHPMPVVTQSARAGFSEFVENVRWIKGGVVFATIHVVGSRNDLTPWTGIDTSDSAENPRFDRVAEFQQRVAAAKAWLDETFALAERIKAPGVYISTQADLLFEVAATDPRRAGFNEIIDSLRAHTIRFGGEVMLAHGDGHVPRIDKPLTATIVSADPSVPAGTRRVENFTRIENYGPPDTHWLRVTVDPRGPQVFKAELMTVKANRNTFQQ